LENAVVTEQDDKKRTVIVSVFPPGKGRIKLNEWQTAVLADSLSKIVQEWPRSSRRFGMNEDLKRLIDVLNKGGYEVIQFEDRCGEIDDGSYRSSGIFELKVFDTSKDRSKS
jgi:hypothetical protein